MNSRTTFDRVVAALALSAVVVAAAVVALVVRREFFPPPPGPSETLSEPIPVDNWEELIAAGHRVGPPDAAATILVFTDFECPACRQFALGPLRDARDRFEDDVRVIYRHWPLPYHRFAYPAARASECAAAQGRFQAFHDLLFEKQDSLGLKPFSEFAEETGVPDILAFEECDSASGPLAAISADSAAARSVGGTGAPTVLVNGLRLPHTRLFGPLVEMAVRGELDAPAIEQRTSTPTLTPWNSAPGLTLEPEFRIDGASVGLTPGSIVAVARTGSMAILQPEAAALVVFDERGRRLGEFSSQGGGHLGRATQLGWLGDTIWAYDLLQEELLFALPPDRIVRTEPLSRNAGPDPSRAEFLPEAFSRILPLALYEDGSIYARSIIPGEPPELPVSATLERYVRINAAGDVSRLVAEVPGTPFVRMRTPSAQYAAGIPFARGALHGVSPEGRYVATLEAEIEDQHGGRLAVVLQSALGDTIYSRAYPFVGIPIPPALADSVLAARVEAMESRELARLLREEAPIPPVYSPALSLVVSDDGTIWIRLRTEAQERNHLVLDPLGNPRGTVGLPESTRVVAVDSSNVWVVEQNTNGAQDVVRYRVSSGSDHHSTSPD